MHTWNVQKIIADCGGPVDLHAKLKAEGNDISLPAVRAWGRRGTIPADWLAEILKVTGRPAQDWIVEDIF